MDYKELRDKLLDIYNFCFFFLLYMFVMLFYFVNVDMLFNDILNCVLKNDILE